MTVRVKRKRLFSLFKQIKNESNNIRLTTTALLDRAEMVDSPQYFRSASNNIGRHRVLTVGWHACCQRMVKNSVVARLARSTDQWLIFVIDKRTDR